MGVGKLVDFPRGWSYNKEGLKLTGKPGFVFNVDVPVNSPNCWPLTLLVIFVSESLEEE